MRRGRRLLAGALAAILPILCGDCGASVEVACASEACGECCLNSSCETQEACESHLDSGTVLYCDGPEDCSSGDTCCAGLPASASFPIVARCTPPAECSMSGVGVVYFCHVDEDCGALGACQPWEFGEYVSVCGG